MAELHHAKALSWHRRVADLLLSTDPELRGRVRLCLIAGLLYFGWAVGFAIWALLSESAYPVAHIFLVDDLLGMSFYFIVRSGVTRKLKDPALVLPQMLFASASCALAYACLPAMRPGVLQLCCLVQVFGLFNLRPRALMINGLGMVAMLIVAAGVSFWMHPSEAPGRAAMQVASASIMLTLLTLVSAHHASTRSRLRTLRTELADAVQRTELLATRDALTGLVNRQHAQDQLTVDLARHDEGGPPLCVAFIDLDHFKGVNDTHGHAAGDAVLKRFADEARAELREIDLLARWGGEEFLLVLRDTARAEVGVNVLARVRARLQSSPLILDDVPIRIGFSAGVVARERGEAMTQVVMRADLALYRAKALGRGRTEVADPGPAAAAEPRPVRDEAVAG